MLHSLTPLVTIKTPLLPLSRTNSGGDVSATVYNATATEGAISGVIDLTLISGFVHASVSAGVVGTSLDGKWQESDDGSTSWTDVTGGAIVQRTTAGTSFLEINTRKFTKRYARFVVTLGGTCVFDVKVLYQLRNAA